MPETASPAHKIDHDELLRVIAPVARSHGVDVVDVTFKPERGGHVLRVTIEASGTTDASGGLSVERCAEVSRDLSAALDVAETIRQAYSLEVSSPGVERPLRTAAEFSRFAGRRAKVVVSEAGPDGQFSYDGTIARVEGDRVVIGLGGHEVSLPVGAVKRAHLVFEFGPAPRPGGKGRRPPAGGARPAVPGARAAGPAPTRDPKSE